MPFSMCCYVRWSFSNEPSVGKIYENLQVMWKWVPHIECLRPKSPARSMSKIGTPYFRILNICGVLCTSSSPHRMPPKTFNYRCHHYVACFCFFEKNIVLKIQSHERVSCPFCLGYAVDRVIFKGSPTIEKWEKHGKTNVSNGNSWVSTVFAGVLGHQNCLYNFKSCQKRWFSAKLNFGLHFIWDVYWCSHIQAWIFQVGSRTPSLDSKMCQFPWISLS